jgi:hypothetical protein
MTAGGVGAESPRAFSEWRARNHNRPQNRPARTERVVFGSVHRPRIGRAKNVATERDADRAWAGVECPAMCWPGTVCGVFGTTVQIVDSAEHRWRPRSRQAGEIAVVDVWGRVRLNSIMAEHRFGDHRRDSSNGSVFLIGVRLLTREAGRF